MVIWINSAAGGADAGAAAASWDILGIDSTGGICGHEVKREWESAELCSHGAILQDSEHREWSQFGRGDFDFDVTMGCVGSAQ